MDKVNLFCTYLLNNKLTQDDVIITPSHYINQELQKLLLQYSPNNALILPQFCTYSDLSINHSCLKNLGIDWYVDDNLFQHKLVEAMLDSAVNPKTYGQLKRKIDFIIEHLLIEKACALNNYIGKVCRFLRQYDYFKFSSRYTIQQLIPKQGTRVFALPPTLINPALRILFRKCNVLKLVPQDMGGGTHNLIECRDICEEAKFIAMRIRKCIEDKQTVAIICDNSELQKLIESHLLRWDIDVLSNRSYIQIIRNESLQLLNVLNLIENFDIWQFLDLINASSMSDYCNAVLRGPKRWNTIEELIALSTDFPVIKQLLIFIKEYSKMEELYLHKFVDEASKQLALTINFGNVIKLKNRLLNKSNLCAIISVLIRNHISNEKRADNTYLNFSSWDEVFNMRYDQLIVADCNIGTSLDKKIFIPGINRKEMRLIGAHDNKFVIDSMRAKLRELSNVIYTRAIFDKAGETTPAQFLPAHRVFKLESSKYYEWINRIPTRIQAQQPQFSVPQDARPRKISVTGIEKLIRNPYAYYAEYVLKLKKTDDLCEEFNNKHFGIAIHSAISDTSISGGMDRYITSFISNFTASVVSMFGICQLSMMLESRLKRMASWLYDYLSPLSSLSHEHKLENEFHINERSIIVSSRADLLCVDQSLDLIIDFKTGGCPSKSEVESGMFPQLAIEYLLFKQQFPQAKIKTLYCQIKGKKDLAEASEIEVDVDMAHNGLCNLLAKFLASDHPFFAPNTELDIKNQNYEHLIRQAEWH
jgi:hypothetical protein